MEFEENNGAEEQEEEAVEIYSKRAIWWFSIIPMPLFGGVLLAINLWTAGYRKATYIVMAFAFVYNLATELLINWMADYYKMVIPLNYKMDNNQLNEKIMAVSGVSIVLNIIGGVVLAEYFFKKYFPDDDYYPKSIVAPLIIAFLIMLFGGFIGI